ncbi:hypothetical protein [Notoacmeibacter marinus]|uniref:hypothetical protein n=1 Tax=Notoacmeibacter marinus TaxID=1876515 RepID=UPI00117B76E7|nr:hypothetical protein [Notoacmeibacter marinus]
MKFVVALFVFFSISLLSHLAKANPPYRCEPNPVSNDAITFVHGDVDVSSFSDPGEGICTFTVEGARKEEPSTRDDEVPIANLLEDAISGDLEPLVRRVFLARINSGRESSDVIGEVVNLLSDQSDSLKQCAEAVRENNSSLSDPIGTSADGGFLYLEQKGDNTEVRCVAYVEGAPSFGRFTIPTLQLSVSVISDETFSHMTAAAPALQ